MKRQTTGVRERTSEFAAPGLTVCFVQTIGRCYCASAWRGSPIQKINYRYLSKFVILSQSFVILSGVTASQGEAVAQSKDPYALLIPRDTCGPTFLPASLNNSSIVALPGVLRLQDDTEKGGPAQLARAGGASLRRAGEGTRPYVFLVKERGPPVGGPLLPTPAFTTSRPLPPGALRLPRWRLLLR